MGAEIFHALKKGLQDAGYNTNVGDEGGFAPDLKSADDALDFLAKSVEAAGYHLGELRIRARSDEFHRGGRYELTGEGKSLDADGMVRFYEDLCARYPIRSIEDGMAEDDWDGWQALTQALGDRVQLVGDDLFVTNPKILAEGIERGIAQRPSGQGQPDRLVERDPGGGRAGAARRLSLRDVAPLGRDRGRHDL